MLRPEYELRSDESRPLAVRPPDDAPSRYEPDGRDDPGREVEELGRDELGRDELEREEDLDGELRRSDDRPCMLLPPRLLGREPELLAGDISVPDFFSSSALFSFLCNNLLVAGVTYVTSV